MERSQRTQGEEIYRSLVENIPDVVWISDSKGNTIFVSPNVKKVFGYTQEEIYQLGSRLWFGRVHPDDADYVKRSYRALFTHGNAYDVEYRVQKKTGEWIWVRDRATATIERSGKRYAQGIFSDITTRKQMEEKTFASENRYRTIFESANDPIVYVDKYGKIIDINSKAEELAGFKRDELIGKSFAKIAVFEPKNLLEIIKIFIQAMRKGALPEGKTAYTMEMEIRHKNGRKITIESSTRLTTKDGNLEGAISVLRDVTERKQIVEELRESEKRYRTLFEESKDAIVITTVDGNIVDFNQAMLDLLGYTREEMLKLDARQQYADPKDRENYQREIAKKGFVKDYPAKFKRKDDTIIDVLMTSTARRAEDGTIQGYQAIIRDITEHKLMEEKLAETSTFLSNVLSQMSDYVWITDEDYTLRFLNEAAKRHHGDAVGEKCYKVTRNLDSPCYHRGIPCEVHELLEKGRDYFEDTRLSPVIGRITHIRATPTTTPEGKRAIVLVSRDATEETRAKEQLEKAYSTLRATLESTADGILVVDNDERITDFNKRYVEMFQTPESILTSRDDRGLVSFVKDQMKDPEGFVNRTRELFAQPDLERSDLLEFKDERIFERHSRPHRIGEKTVGRVVSFRDITERRRAENALKDSEEFSSSLMENSLNPILVVNPDTSIRYVNPTLEKLTGYSSSELIGTKPPFPWWPKGKIKDTTSRLEENMRRGLTHYEENFKRKNGEDFWVEINAASIMRNGVIKYYLSSWVDITERKTMEEELRRYSQQLEKLVEERTQALRASEEKYRLLIDNMAEVMFTIDLNGNFTFVSPQAESMTGYSMGQLLSMNMRQLVAPEYLPEIQKRLRARIQGEKDLPVYAFEIIRADGERVPVEMQTTPVHDEKGTLIAVQGVARDITERRKIEQMKDRFISAVTHELRTPLTSISGYADLALSDKSGPLNKEIRNVLEVIKRNTDRLISITDDLLDIRRMESGKLKLSISSLNLKEIVDHCSVEIKPFLKAKQELHIQVPDVLPSIQGDRVRLSQVLMNLLSNAAKFTPEGGNIRLSVKDEEGMVKVQVSDTGIGIRNEDLERVFEPFAAIQKPTYIKGTGLGLSVTKGLVNAHGGQIIATSDGEGKGATFTFTLPKHEAKEVSQTA